MKTPRSLVLFEQAIKSDATKRVYRFYLSKFMEFCKVSDFDELVNMAPQRLQVILEDYLFELKKDHSPRSVHIMFNALELFFSMNDVILNFKKIRRMFPALVKPTGSDAYSTKDVQEILSVCKTKKHRAFVHLLAASGVRIGAVAPLKLKHIKEIGDGCKAITVYADTKDCVLKF